MHFSIDRTVHTTAFDKPVVDHWLERKIALKKEEVEGYIIPKRACQVREFNMHIWSKLL